MRIITLKQLDNGYVKTSLIEHIHLVSGEQTLTVYDDNGLGSSSIIFHNTHSKDEHVLIDEDYIERLKNLLKIY